MNIEGEVNALRANEIARPQFEVQEQSVTGGAGPRDTLYERCDEELGQAAVVRYRQLNVGYDRIREFIEEQHIEQHRPVDIIAMILIAEQKRAVVSCNRWIERCVRTECEHIEPVESNMLNAGQDGPQEVVPRLKWITVRR